LTFLEKVDQLATVDCRDFKKKIATVATVATKVDCRLFLDFAVDFAGILLGFCWGFQWESGCKMASKSLKSSEILQQLTFLEKVDHTVDYGFKS
jgi:hypothetical protein